jgi:hypothetical protein
MKSIFEREKHSSCQNSSPTCYSVMNKQNVSSVVCLTGEEQMCTMKHNLHACLLHDNALPHTAEKYV